jgi:DNA polymerase III alpha subunit
MACVSPTVKLILSVSVIIPESKHDIDERKANEIFDLIDKFSGYGFNKSHSVAYAYVSYQTAAYKNQTSLDNDPSFHAR